MRVMSCLLVLSLPLLGGCTADAQYADQRYADRRCDRQGLAEGSPEFQACEQREKEERARGREQFQQNLYIGGA